MSDVAISAGTKPVVSPTIDTRSNSGGNSSSTTAKRRKTKPATSKVKVIKMGLNYGTIYLTKGKSKTLKATVSPSNATNKSVKWSSSNKKIAAVNAKGKVTGKKAETVDDYSKGDGWKRKEGSLQGCRNSSGDNRQKTTTSTAATSQTKSIITTSGTTNRSVSTGSSQLLRERQRHRERRGTIHGKYGQTTTAKKKNTAAEATTGGWSFSGDNYAADERTMRKADTRCRKGRYRDV